MTTHDTHVNVERTKLFKIVNTCECRILVAQSTAVMVYLGFDSLPGQPMGFSKIILGQAKTMGPTL